MTDKNKTSKAHYDLDDLNLNKKQEKVLFSILGEHHNHTLTISDTTDHTERVTEYEVECIDCQEVILRAYNPHIEIE